MPLQHTRVARVEDVAAVGDTMKVVVLEVDNANRKIKMSRKALIAK